MSAGWTERAEAPGVATLSGVEREAWREGQAPRRGQGRLWLATGLGLASIAFLAYAPKPRAPVAPPANETAAPSASFRRQADLPSLLSLQSIDAGREAISYQARRRDSDGERRDTLALGDPSASQAFFRVTARVMGAASQPTDLFVEMARQAAEVGLAVDRASTPQRFLSERGPLLISELVLEGATQRACLGFRFDAASSVDLSGMACGAAGKPIERRMLECLIERLRATPAGAAKGLERLLGGAPAVGRQDCGRAAS
jgi:hypothetical protein